MSVLWRRSSDSADGGQDCVETGDEPGMVLVRDTKNCGGATLALPAQARAKFTATLQ